MPLLETPTLNAGWHRALFESGLQPYQRSALERLMLDNRPMDSIRLALPWGEERSFLVPAADPLDPSYDWFTRGTLVTRTTFEIGRVVTRRVDDFYQEAE